MSARALESFLKPGQAPTRWRVVWPDGLNVRSAPTITARIVGGLEPGSIFEQAGCNGDWVQLATPDDGPPAAWVISRHAEAGLLFMERVDTDDDDVSDDVAAPPAAVGSAVPAPAAAAGTIDDDGDGGGTADHATVLPGMCPHLRRAGRHARL